LKLNMFDDKEIDQFEDFYHLPDSTANTISVIISPFYEYFVKELPLRFDEILKISQDRIRLNALEDIHQEAINHLNKYKIHYKKYIDEITECHLSSRYSNKKTYFEGVPKARDISYSMADVPYSIENVTFRDNEYEFENQLGIVFEELRKLRIKVEINEKYKIRGKPVKKHKPQETIDTEREFINLFKRSEVGLNFIKMLKTHEYIAEDDVWKGISNELGELRDAYYALFDLQLLQSGGSHIKALRVFYNRFGLITREQGGSGYISERALRNQNFTKDYETFKKMFQTLKSL